MNGFAPLAPPVILVAGAAAVFLLGTFRKTKANSVPAAVSTATLVTAGASAALLWGRAAGAFGGRLRWDEPAIFLAVLFLLGAGLAVLLNLRYAAHQGTPRAETGGLLILSACGLVLMTATTDLLVVFLGLEVYSVSAYALTGFLKRDDRSAEAAAKYFLVGSFSSAFVVFGLALLFGATGSLDISATVAAPPGTEGLMALAGLALVLSGLAFKIALVPFHMVLPDVYEGAPTPVAAFFAAAPKAAGFAVLLRILVPRFRAEAGNETLLGLLGAVAVATMIFGNFAALRQRNIKRLLAYSGIAHAGYMLTAVIASDSVGLLFYLAVYLFMGLGAFAAVVALGGPGRETLELDEFAGIGRRYPWVGGLFTVFLFSLAGFPPTGGFLAKFYVFSAAVRAGHVGLALIGVATSLVSVYYYLRIVRVMYMKEPGRELEVDAENPAAYLVLFFCLYAVLQLGLFPGSVLNLIHRAAAGF